MNIEIKYPEKKYPYLAYWVGSVEPFPKTYTLDDVVIINEIHQGVYVSYINGNKVGYFTKHEHEYSPLPIGTEIKIVQS